MFDHILKEKLKNAKSIAIVGAKDKEGQPVDRVGKYLMARGFKVYPIHPVRKNVWGLETFKSIPEFALALKERNEDIDIICLFRASEYCYDHAVETIESGINPKLFWLQEGIKSEEAGKYMHEHKVPYVEDLCVKIEYDRFFPQEFNCTMCGVCCEGKNGIVVDDSVDLPRLLEYFSCDIEELDEKYTVIHNGKRVLRSQDDGTKLKCLFYTKEKSCTIHLARPSICRAWPYFKGNMLDNVSLDMAKSDCEGIQVQAKHSAFQKEGLAYLKEQNLLKDFKDKSAANALRYSQEELSSLAFLASKAEK